jgi:hypothetical protein
MKMMLRLLVLLLGVLMLPATAYAQNNYGDVNGDGEVNIADVNAVIAVILGSENSSSADVNGDGEVNIADVNVLIDIILNGNVQPQPVPEYVDLGLPSGTLWATRNVGAANPEDYGDHFAWGETETKETYNWNTYKWCEGNEWSITKYDPLWYDDMELELEDDAAFVNCGPNWRMPSQAQFEELCNDCSWQWTTVNGVNGNLVTGPNGNSIFLPAAGYRSTSAVTHEGRRGYYWSRTVDYAQAQYAYNLGFESNIPYFYPHMLGRRAGYSVRPVRFFPADEQPLLIVQHSLDMGQVFIEEVRTDELTFINNTNEAVDLTVATDDPFSFKQDEDEAFSMTIVVPGNSIVTVTVIFLADTPGDYNGNVTIKSSALDGGQSVIPVHAQVISDDITEHEYVDLGLPSGTLWATCNIGASAPEECGDYFAWGETTPKDYYAWSTYKWFATGANRSGFTKYCCDSPAGYLDFADGKTELNSADDAATMNWGPNWQMPSDDQLDELAQSCSWQWTQRNGVNGYLVTGPNGKTLFLPLTGLYVGSSRTYAAYNGEYWSRTLFTEYYSSSRACYMSFYDEDWYWFGTARFYGLPVRAVRASN